MPSEIPNFQESRSESGVKSRGNAILLPSTPGKIRRPRSFRGDGIFDDFLTEGKREKGLELNFWEGDFAQSIADPSARSEI